MHFIMAFLTGVLVFSTALPADAAQPRAVPPSGLLIFLLVGQSNMFGIPPVENPPRPLDDRIWMLDPLSGWRVASDPLHSWLYGNTGQGGVGPGMPFARGLLTRDPSLRIGLIPCASGGRIRDWQRDAPPIAGGPVSQYQRCLSLARAAQAYGQVAGMLTYQGEADTCCPNLPGYQEPAGGQWRQLYERMATDLRADLGAPDLPAVHAQLATNDAGPAQWPDWDVVKASQAAVSLPHAAMIRTEDLRPLFDGLHLTTASQQIAGARFADAWWALRAACSPRPPVRIRRDGSVVSIAASSPIMSVTFGQIRNATTTPPAITGTLASFTITSSSGGPVAWMVPFTVTDGCGAWQTFVGAGG